MATSRIPKLCRHRSRNQGYVTLDGREHYLGHWPGRRPPADVRARYDELIASWLANGKRLPPESTPVTANDLILAYLKWAEAHYVPRRKKDDQNRFIRYALKVVRQGFGRTPAAEFGPKRLRAVQQAMIELGWSRSTINAQVDRVRRMFKWAVAEELVPGDVYHALRAVEGVRRGTPGVREGEPIRPVTAEIVEATLPYMTPTVRAMVRVQLLTGMRPGEVCQLRAGDIDSDRTDGVWVYRPAVHKTQHHGHDRVVILGPQAQAILTPFLCEAQPYLFDPRAAEAARNGDRRQNRRRPRTPSQNRRQPKAVPRRPKRERYDETSYRNAVYRACDKAFPTPEPLVRRPGESTRAWRTRLTGQERLELTRWRSEHRWHPNQLRHTAATVIRKDHGIETARIILGHSKLTTTEIYAEADREHAAAVMARIG